MTSTKAEANDVQDAANTPFVVVNILKDELSYKEDKLREWIIRPSRAMAGLRKPSRGGGRKKSLAEILNIV